MKKTFYGVALLSLLLTLEGCGTTPSATSSVASSASSASNATGLASLLGNTWGAIIGNSASVKQADLLGTWNYQAPDCRFESENLLKQAGGEIAAKEVEAKMSEAFSKVGITKGACQFTFAENGNCSVTMGGRTISGTYTFGESTRQLAISGAFGLLNMTGVVCRNGKSLSILFDSQKLLSLISVVGSLSHNAAVKSMSSILGSYDGMKVGFEMKK